MLVAVNKNVLVALSGGVDSSVCVHLLKEQGYNVKAVVLRMSPCHDYTVNAAQMAADSLDVPLEIVDMQKEFDEKIINYFVNEYQQGRTPNPCIFCNPQVKFKALVDVANRLDCEFIATGHYARLEKSADGKTKLLRGKSLSRDQSYMLYRLTQNELSRLIFPLCDLEKPCVREIAAKLNLACATAPDSQENCFIADNDYAGYIEKRVGKQKKGDFISPTGEVCGRHEGIIHYTVGQRKGLGIALGKPVFIKKIDAQQNKIYLANKGDDVEAFADINQITSTSGTDFDKPFFAEVKIRSAALPIKAKIIPMGNDVLRIEFQNAQRAVAVGQSIVIYDGDEVLGGGVIM